MKIDLHTHILPRDWPDLDAKYGYSGFVRLDHYESCRARMMIGDRVFREITDNVWDPKRRIVEMDAAGVSMQVLSTVPVMFSYWARPKDALDLSRFLNDHIAEVVRENPNRFVGLGTIPLQDVDLAARELERFMSGSRNCALLLPTAEARFRSPLVASSTPFTFALNWSQSITEPIREVTWPTAKRPRDFTLIRSCTMPTHSGR